MMRGNAIVDATTIAALPSTKTKERACGPKMHQVEKGSTWHFWHEDTRWCRLWHRLRIYHQCHRLKLSKEIDMQDEYRINLAALREMLLAQRKSQMKGGLYHTNQIDFAYNSNRIEGSRLTHEQTRYIFETKTVDGVAPVNDVIEMVNSFRLFCYL
jgi:hypothetical protein